MIVPWGLAAGVLVSSTAGAVQDPMEAPSPRQALIGSDKATAEPGASHENRPLTLAQRGIRPASGIDVRPGLLSVGAHVSAELAFADDRNFLPPSVLQDDMLPATRTLRHFGPAQKTDGRSSEVGHSDVAPNRTHGITSPAALPALAALRPDGASPSLPRAVTLASTTPAPIEPEIVAMPAGLAPALAVGRSEDGEGADKPHPNYAELIDPGEMSREQRCLAEAVYFEARSEPPAGQAAVAQVVLNRVKSGLYPPTVCGVVYQDRSHYKACQFSFACEGKSLRITEPGPWRQAVKTALDVTEGKTYLSKVGDALNYHADYVRPYWARFLKKNDTIGRHIFYSLRTSQR